MQGCCTQNACIIGGGNFTESSIQGHVQFITSTIHESRCHSKRHTTTNKVNNEMKLLGCFHFNFVKISTRKIFIQEAISLQFLKQLHSSSMVHSFNIIRVEQMIFNNLLKKGCIDQKLDGMTAICMGMHGVDERSFHICKVRSSLS